MKSAGKRAQQYRVDRYFEEQSQKLEYEAVMKHAPEVMAQTEAMFLLALKMKGYGPKRLKKAHEEFVAILNMPTEILGKLNTTGNLMEFFEKEYGIDFSEIHPKFPSFEEAIRHEKEAGTPL